MLCGHQGQLQGGAAAQLLWGHLDQLGGRLWPTAVGLAWPEQVVVSPLSHPFDTTVGSVLSGG